MRAAVVFALVVAPVLTRSQAIAPATEPGATSDSGVDTGSPSDTSTPGASSDSSRQPLRVATIEVLGRPEVLEQVPGAGEVVGRSDLEESRVTTPNEALRRAAGVGVRDEEGLGLRPNIGIRGLNPTRSAKLLLLEDGIPLGFAPYGDNTAYYHPPIERYERIEILKGSGQVLFGPQTIGGVINYVTPAPPLEPGGQVTVMGGNRGFVDTRLRYGGTWNGRGLLVDLLHKQGQGARDNTRTQLNDVSAKLVLPLSDSQSLTWRASGYSEESQLTYSGLTRSEYESDPRQNPFKNDHLSAARVGSSLTHEVFLSDSASLTTALYGSWFDRDWWRQSSNSTQRPNDASDQTCGGMDNLNTSCGNEGRLRSYLAGGIEPRLRLSSRLAGLPSELEVGVRFHAESQDRVQQNGPLPTSREGDQNALKEDNLRSTQALAAFAQERLTLGDWTVSPGVRVEHVRYRRENRLEGQKSVGETALTQMVPGVGVTWKAGSDVTLFGGLHRGFAPPRAEDIVNKEGGVVELDPELSWNSELGMRSRLGRFAQLDVTAFRLDFENQIIPASLAGGTGAALTNAGASLHQGAEVSARLQHPSGWNGHLAWTWLPVARFEGDRLGLNGTRVTGNRLPYAPEHLGNASVGWGHSTGPGVRVDGVLIGEQFADDLNTVDVSDDGQRGRIDAALVWNASARWVFDRSRWTVFGTVKNLLDTTYVVDRSRGTLPGSPRLVQLGANYAF